MTKETTAKSANIKRELLQANHKKGENEKDENIKGNCKKSVSIR